LPKTVEALDTVWEFVAFLATAFIFLVVGFAIPLRTLASAAIPIAWAIAAALVGRAFIIYVLLNAWRESRRWWRILTARRAGLRGESEHRAEKSRAADQIPLPFDWLHVVFWSGLRGAVSTALALSLPVDFPNREQLQAVTFGVVLFTLVVQATTADVVVARWGRKPKDSGAARNARRAASAASKQRVAGSPPVAPQADATGESAEPAQTPRSAP
jgi:CPA1 family monovalent cation:H+ antiporter